MTRQEALLTSITVAVTLIAGEVAARFLLRPPVRISALKVTSPVVPKHVPDPVLGWKILPQDAKYCLPAGANGSKAVYYSIERGYRATASQPAKGPVVVAAGCSFTFGLGLNDEDTWPWMLQQHLAGYHVVNTGTNGYGTDQALLSAESVIEHSTEPVRLVLLGFGDFQIERNRASQFVLCWPYPSGKPLFLPKGGGVEYAGLVRFWFPGSLLDHSVLFMSLTNKLANTVNRIPSHEGAREATARLIAEFGRRFEARGARLAVLILPHAGDWLTESVEDQKFILEQLHAAGIPVLVPEFPRSNGRLDGQRFLIPRDKVHPNRDYNVLLTGQLAKFIDAQQLLAQ